MKLLLDTHTLLWWLDDNPKLSAEAREAIGNSENEVYISAVTAWEIIIKKRLGKLRAPARLDREITAHRFEPLSITLAHALALDRLPDHHEDPFDRMRDAGIVFGTAGENLALAPTLDIAHDGLMNSPGHRANILGTQFRKVGIGVLDGGVYALTALTGLFGPALRVSAMARTIMSEHVIGAGPAVGRRFRSEVADSVHLHLDFGPLFATLDVSWCVQASRNETLEVYGEHGTLSGDPTYANTPIHIFRPGSGWSVEEPTSRLPRSDDWFQGVAHRTAGRDPGSYRVGFQRILEQN